MKRTINFSDVHESMIEDIQNSSEFDITITTIIHTALTDYYNRKFNKVEVSDK